MKNLANDRTMKLKYLKWWDIGILTLIMFSSFILISFLSVPDSNTMEAVEFTTEANWQALGFQSVLLIIAFSYLYFRKFQFRQWKVKMDPKSIFTGILIFLSVAFLFDLYQIGVYGFLASPAMDETIPYDTEAGNHLLAAFSTIDLSLILYSLFNGFYEEIFFLGICLSVPPEKRSYYFLYSLVVRYSFHTYQGEVTAFGIGLIVGTVYYICYIRQREKNLFPFFLAHAIADVFGAGIIGYFD